MAFPSVSGYKLHQWICISAVVCSCLRHILALIVRVSKFHDCYGVNYCIKMILNKT